MEILHNLEKDAYGDKWRLELTIRKDGPDPLPSDHEVIEILEEVILPALKAHNYHYRWSLTGYDGKSRLVDLMKALG